jgi:hypothetical protein
MLLVKNKCAFNGVVGFVERKRKKIDVYIYICSYVYVPNFILTDVTIRIITSVDHMQSNPYRSRPDIAPPALSAQLNSVNRNSLLYSISIYSYIRHTFMKCG